MVPSIVVKVPTTAPLVVFAHRPLFDLFPSWDWATKDGAKAIEILEKHPLVTVFYGHIHQEHHQQTGRIAHHAERSLIVPLPAPGSVPKKAPLPWDPKSADHGLATAKSRALLPQCESRSTRLLRADTELLNIQ